MNIKIEKDINNNQYLVVDVLLNSIDSNGIPFNSLLSDFITTVPNSKVLFNKLCQRNKGKFHITLLNVPNYKKCGNVMLPLVINDIVFKGIGSISKNGDTTFFVVVESNTIQNELKRLNIKQDLHITIGFNSKDLFHDRKTQCNIVKI